MTVKTPTLLVLAVVVIALVAISGCKSVPEPSQPAASAQPPPAATTSPVATTTPSATSGEGVGQPAPDFTVTDIDGASHSRGKYDGKILVVDFWATYCKPCVKKLREYESIYQMFKGRGVEFLALSMDESDEVIKGWRQQNDVSFPLARLDDVTKRSFFGDASLVPIPQMRILDRQGTIRYSFGPDGTTEEVETAIKTLVEEKR